ncbi:MAG TPA: thrombospondin type 3 repeat-containing protein [Phycisphaerae bacterium]|jgi:hypothetical protein
MKKHTCVWKGGLLTIPIMLVGCAGTTTAPPPDSSSTPPVPGPPVDALTPLVTTEGNGRVNTTLQGSQVILEAMADPGWMFAGWTGIVSTANPVTIFPGAQDMIGARFVPVPDLSSDGDGVPDDVDLCPGTRPGATVDAFGCSAAQRDSDGDGITDDFDQCPGTPLGALINAVGCAANQLDDDYDGVPNNLDYCPDTPFRAAVNVLGCSLNQFDTDLDGVLNPFDICPDTPAGAEPDSNGCARGEPGYGLSLNGDCASGACAGQGAICGNGQLEEGEECDPPDGVNCDDGCQFIQFCNASGPGSSTWSSTQRLFKGAGLAPDDGYSTPEVYELDSVGNCILARVMPDVSAIAAITGGTVTVVHNYIPVRTRTVIFRVDDVDAGTILEEAQISYYDLISAEPGGQAILIYCYRLIDDYPPYDGSTAVEYSFWGDVFGTVSADGNTIHWTSVSAGGLAAEINGTWTRTCGP